MTIPTTERLARALEELNDPKLSEMVAKARAGYYDDFKSDLAQPLTTLYMDLMDVGHPEMAQRVVDGEFDSTKEEAEAWMEAEGRDILKLLMLSEDVDFRRFIENINRVQWKEN